MTDHVADVVLASAPLQIVDSVAAADTVFVPNLWVILRVWNESFRDHPMHLTRVGAAPNKEVAVSVATQPHFERNATSKPCTLDPKNPTVAGHAVTRIRGVRTDVTHHFTPASAAILPSTSALTSPSRSAGISLSFVAPYTSRISANLALRTSCDGKKAFR